MEQPRSKSKIVTRESNDITFKVLCVAPRSLPANTDTAIYEIDIQSDFEFCNGNGRARLKKSSGEISIKGITTRDSATETTRITRRQDSKSRMIQSYYPTLLDTCAEGSESQLDLHTKFKEVAFAVDMEDSHREEEMSKTDVAKSTVDITDVEKPVVEIVEVQKPVVEIAEVQKPVVEISEVQKPVIQITEVQKPVVQIAEVQKLVVQIADSQKPFTEKPVAEKPVVEKPVMENSVVEKSVVEKPVVEISEVKKPEDPKPAIVTETVDPEKSSSDKPKVKRSYFEKPSSRKGSLDKGNVPKVVVERADIDKVGIEEVGMRKLGIESSEIGSVDLEQGGVKKVGVRKVNIDKTDFEKADADKPEKENQTSISDKLQQHIKTFLIENFFEKNNPDLKALFQGYEKKAEPNELHLHHHEHHHHYYFDGNPFGTEKSPTEVTPPKEAPKPNHGWSAEKGPDAPLNGPGPSVFYRCEANSNTTFRVTKSHMTEEFKDGRIGSAQCSVSEESVFDQKSEFMKSHTYSETEISKAPSETEVTQMKKSSLEPKKSCSDKLNVLATSLKNAATYKSPLIITEHEKLPTLSYITCDCNSLETIPQTSTVSFSSDLNTEELEELEELGNSDKTSGESESSVPTGNTRTGPNFSSRKMYFEVWTAKLKTELKQIKKELKRFEKEHAKRKLRNGNAESRPGKKIAVYSSKTFIIGSGNVYVANNCETRELGDCGGFLYKKQKVSYGETVLEEALSSPVEKKNPKKRQIFRALREIVLQRV